MIQGGFDFDKEYGIVLEGGGAKGAYQIGAWKALIENGVKIKAVSGVSVGALNGALICMGDYEKAVDIWKNISYSSIMNVDDNQMDKLVNRRFKEINLQEVRHQGRKFLVSGGIDVTPLKQLIDENIDEQKIRESDIEFIMGTFDVGSMKEREISAKETQDGYLKDYLLASSNFPVFKNEKLHGKTYLDGGIVNNVPIDMLINRGYKDIIVIRIYGLGLEKKVKIPEDVRVTYIAPRASLCNVLEFDKKKAVRNITLGYYDTLRILKSLAGKEYYIDSKQDEKDYLKMLLNIDEEQAGRLLPVKKQEINPEESICRKLTEEIFPGLAAVYRLDKNWSYGRLYYAILEYCAKKLRIKRYKVYSEQEFALELLNKIHEKAQTGETPDIQSELARSILKDYASLRTE